MTVYSMRSPAFGVSRFERSLPTVTNDLETLSPSQRQAILEGLESSDPSVTVAPGYQASIRICHGPEGRFAVKEPSGWGLRNTLSLASIRREAEVYRRLKGIPGIPLCYGCLDDRYLVLEHIPGDTLDALDVGLTNREAFYARLLETLRMMHDAGVAHGDLKRKRNILVGPGGKPFVIDFGIAVVAKDRRGLLFELARQVDRNAWIKHKYRGRTENISAEDSAIYKPMRSERLMRLLRPAWQAATLRRWRKKRRNMRQT